MTGHDENTLAEQAINFILHLGPDKGLPRAAEILAHAATLCERAAHLQIAPRERSLKAVIAEMYLHGVSTRELPGAIEKLRGLDVSFPRGSRVTNELDEKFEKWRQRPLPEIAHLVLDALHVKARIVGTVRDCAVFIAIGVRREDGKRMGLGISTGLSGSEVRWRDFLVSLKQRGIGSPDLVIADAHEGLKAALRATMNSTPWVESALPEGLGGFASPAEGRERPRAANARERLNREIRRCERVIGCFPNEASVPRLVTAILMEISEEWETGHGDLPVGEGTE